MGPPSQGALEHSRMGGGASGEAAWQGAAAPKTTHAGEMWAAETEIGDTQRGGQTGEYRRGNGSQCLTAGEGSCKQEKEEKKK